MQGINPQDFSYTLNPTENLETPQSVICYSLNGIGGVSRELNRLYRNNLCRSEWATKDRPILINNWEATYFDFTLQRTNLFHLPKPQKKQELNYLYLMTGGSEVEMTIFKDLAIGL